MFLSDAKWLFLPDPEWLIQPDPNNGELFYPDYPTEKFKEIIRNSPELPQKVTFRGLRSSCASILVHEGLDIKAVQKWMGHKDVETTLKYYAIAKDKTAKKEVSASMSNLIQIKKYDNNNA